MNLKEKVKEKIKEIESDDRMNYPSANVRTNAPLALIQTDMEGQLKSLKWVLNELEDK